jgi:hypothetical protein
MNGELADLSRDAEERALTWINAVIDYVQQD